MNTTHFEDSLPFAATNKDRLEIAAETDALEEAVTETQDTIKQRLQAARALIDQPEHWTKGALRRDAAGCPVVLPHHTVASRCAFGAILEACSVEEEREVRRHLMASVNSRTPEGYYSDITNWNDARDRTHAEVLQAFDRAIEDRS